MYPLFRSHQPSPAATHGCFAAGCGGHKMSTKWFLFFAKEKICVHRRLSTCGCNLQSSRHRTRSKRGRCRSWTSNCRRKCNGRLATKRKLTNMTDNQSNYESTNGIKGGTGTLLSTWAKNLRCALSTQSFCAAMLRIRVHKSMPTVNNLSSVRLRFTILGCFTWSN